MQRSHLLALALAASLALTLAPSAQGDEAPAFAGPDHPIVVLNPTQEKGWLTSPNGMARVLRLAEGEGAFFAVMELEPGASVPLHRDSTEEYILLMDGGGTLSLDGVSHELAPGSVVYMKPNAEVSFVNGPRKSRVFQIFAGPEPARKYDSWTVAPRTTTSRSDLYRPLAGIRG